MVTPRSTGVPGRRVVLLGASNAVRGIATVVDAARLSCDEPLEFLAAVGHGRSYELRTWFLGRELPSIVACGLWQALERRPALPCCAVVTDIGNDILYGVPVENIVRQVTECLDRLAAQDAQIVLTGLPLESIGKLSKIRFGLLRTCFFPPSRVTLDEALQAGRELDAQLAALAAQRNVPFLRPRGDWYGWDPIHYKTCCRRAAWQAMFSPLAPNGANSIQPRRSFANWLRLVRAKPERQIFWGIKRHHAQPAVTLRDGTQVSFY